MSQLLFYFLTSTLRFGFPRLHFSQRLVFIPELVDLCGGLSFYRFPWLREIKKIDPLYVALFLLMV